MQPLFVTMNDESDLEIQFKDNPKIFIREIFDSDGLFRAHSYVTRRRASVYACFFIGGSRLAIQSS